MKSHKLLCKRPALACWALLFWGIQAQQAEQCGTEPWGRYSASGGQYENYLYSIGGDTSSVADQRRGGVVQTNFRFDLNTRCWERITNSPVALGYRATATLLNGDFYVFGGADINYQAVDHFWKLSLPDHTWTDITNATSPNRPTARYKHAAVKLSDTTMLIHGGRQDDVVLSDAWIFDIVSMHWMTLLPINVTAYRHGIAYDTKRFVVWIYGGLDGSFTRKSTLHKFDVLSFTMSPPIQYTGATPGNRASFALEYLPELDALLLYGGTCNGEADLLLYNISDNSWCSLSPARRPSRRDAMLWAFDYPTFYMYSGDVICVAIGDVYSIADVHTLDMTDPQSWDLVYNPRNERSPDLMEVCDGTNARMCRAPPFLPDSVAGESTCEVSSDTIPSQPQTAMTTPSLAGAPASTITSSAPSQASSPSSGTSSVYLKSFGRCVSMVFTVLLTLSLVSRS